jgi:hypothetical protein
VHLIVHAYPRGGKMALENSTIVSQSGDALATEVDGEIVLIGIDTGQYYGLDAIGSTIWRGLAQPCRVGDLCARLQADFDGDAETIERDTIAFLEKLTARKLVSAA